MAILPIGRIRLQRLADRSSASLIPFVVAHTEPGSHLRTDENSAYRRTPDRKVTQVNLSGTPIPAHISFKWIHIVFANLKRWALGTFHGFREKHIDAYLNEFVFRWNRRRHFRSAMDSMLGIGRRIGPMTYRSIVGDTRQWKKEHINEIFKMLHPNKQKIVSDLVGYYGVSRLEVMENLVRWVDRLIEEDRDAYLAYRWDFEGVREFADKTWRLRKKPTRPVLTPRRPGEERRTDRRYPNPQALAPRILPRPPAARMLTASAAE